MITPEQIRQFALSLPETDEQPHFNITGFRVKKKVFATLNPTEHRATLRFSQEDQDVFTAVTQDAVYPVPNRWGHYGWTHLDLKKADWELAEDAVLTAWREVAPSAFRKKYPALYYIPDDE